MKSKHLLGFVASLLVLIGSTPSAFAGWTAVNLHPAWSSASYAQAVSNGQQVGFAHSGSGTYTYARGSLWSGTVGSWVSLYSSWGGSSYVADTCGDQQVGSTGDHGAPDHACLWTRTDASCIDLNPAGSDSSGALGVSNGQQVGYASFQGFHAGLWTGTAASWVDLNPAGSIDSMAYAVSDGKQVGYARFGYYRVHASLWSGTAASWVDLSPAGSVISYAYDISDGQQVGSANFLSGTHAGVWRGTAASWVDLNPMGAEVSYAYGTSHGRQAGYAFVGGTARAGMWSGTAESWMDLHSLLPANYTSSEAKGIDVRDGQIWVVGSAYNLAERRDEAMLWHYIPDTVPEPSSLLALGGGLAAVGIPWLRRRRR